MRCHFYLVILWMHDASIHCEAVWLRNDDNNHVYYFSDNERRKWPDARDMCEDMGAYLVTINIRAENEFLYDSYTGYGDHWIGLRCGSGTCDGDNGLTWVNGDSDYRDFNGIASIISIRYVYADFGEENWYGSTNSNDEKRYICEKPDGCHNPSNPCQNVGRCTPDNSNGYTCTCDAGFTGGRCQTNLHCASQPCTHGSCREGTDSYICDCVGTGYTGTECNDDINECSDNSHNCVTNNGPCNNTVGRFTCVCNDGWTGRRCQTNINECRCDPCQHGGSCNDDVNGYSCTCTVHYTRSQCEYDIDECRESTGICNKGTCNNIEGAFTCMCYHGYTGELCDRDVNECSDNGNICQNQGTCVNTPGSYQCVCVPGYTGQNCEEEIDECESDPCMNGGTCTDMVNGFTCTCPSNYQGTNCTIDVNECLQDDICGPGNCTNTHGAFMCDCPQGFGGLNCIDIDECLKPNPCNSHGNCTNNHGGYICECEPGYSDDDYCQPKCLDDNSCNRHGQCHNTDEGFVCSCEPDFYGERCEMTTGSGTFSSNLAAIGFMVVSLILLLLLFAAAAFIIVTRQQWIPRFRRETSEPKTQPNCTNTQGKMHSTEPIDSQNITLELESNTYENARSVSSSDYVNITESALEINTYEQLGPTYLDGQQYELDAKPIYTSLRTPHFNRTN